MTSGPPTGVRRTPGWVLSRARAPGVALETTLLCHGVPRERAPDLSVRIEEAVRDAGANPATIGVVDGRPTVGLTDDELAGLIAANDLPKLNAANLGLAMHAHTSGATTVSATVELAAAAGLGVVATGGLGGVHREIGARLDVSADLAALARHPVCVVTSGVKSILDVESTRELLETLGIPVVGFRTDAFPAFYVRESRAGVDGRFDDPADLANFVRAETARTGRGVVVANPIPADEEIDATRLQGWIDQAAREAATRTIGERALTPFVLDRLHDLSGGATLRANIALVLSNASLAARVAVAMER